MRKRAGESTYGRIESRWRDPYEPTRIPRAAGLCITCLRQMWTNLPQENRRKKVTVATDGIHCEPCLRYIRATGNDPRDKHGNSAEVLPTERAEDDQWWRDSNLTGCVGVGGGPFDPDPFPEEKAAQTAEEKQDRVELRRYIAAFVCGPCPVAEECRRAARVHAYEGMWGGRFFTRTAWVDPLTGLRGPTIHTREPDRTRMIAKLAEKGYDSDGEPLSADATG